MLTSLAWTLYQQNTHKNSEARGYRVLLLVASEQQQNLLPCGCTTCLRMRIATVPPLACCARLRERDAIMGDKFRFSIDRGGTFTDVYAECPGGRVRVMKLLSEDPASYPDAPREAIRRIMENV